MKKQNILKFFQKLSRAFLVPLSLIAAASLVMGIASLFTTPQIIKALPFLGAPAVQYVAYLFLKLGGLVTGNYAVIYVITLAFSLADDNKEFAAFSGFMGYLSFLTGMSILISSFPEFAKRFPTNGIVKVLGIQTVNVGMLGGILVGILTAVLHNKLRHTKLPMAFAFFQGVRFVPIACMTIFLIAGQIFPFIWIYVSIGIKSLATVLNNLGIFGPFLYATVERLLIPTGLHQIWNTVVRDTAVSGVYHFASGAIIEGQRPAFLQYLAEGQLPIGTQLRNLVRFSFGPQIPIMLGALPAIALAIYHSADKDKRGTIKPLIVTGIVTAMIAGISEPIEFIFLFTAPLLYVVYALLNGLSWLLMYLLGNQIGYGSGIIEFTVFGLLRPESHWWAAVIVTIFEAVTCYLLFRWWIAKFDVKTPGRGGDYDESLSFASEIANVSLNDNSKNEIKTTDPKALKAQIIIKGLGGKENIKTVDSCMSRLRVEVNDMSLVDKEIIKKTGCAGIVEPDETNIQIVYGTTVGLIASAVKKELSKM